MALPDDLSKMKVTQLRAELKRRKLATTGLKQELVDRLSEAVEAEKAGQQQQQEEQQAQDEEEAEQEPEEEKAESGAKDGDDNNDDDGKAETKNDDGNDDEQTPASAEKVAENVNEDVTSQEVEAEDDTAKPESAPNDEKVIEDQESMKATTKDDDTSMEDAPQPPAADHKEETASNDEEEKKESKSEAPQIVELTEEHKAEGSSKTISELQPTVETAAPTPLPRQPTPKAKENVIEGPTPAGSAPATTAPTPIASSAPEREMTDASSSAESDIRKRKRRSKSPPLQRADVDAKKQKIEENEEQGAEKQDVDMQEAPREEEDKYERRSRSRSRSRSPRSPARRSRSRSRSPSRTRSRTPRPRDYHNRDSRTRSRTRSRSRSPSRSRSRSGGRERPVIHGRERSRSPLSRHSRSPSPPARQRGSITSNAKDARFKGLFNKDESSTAGAPPSEGRRSSPRPTDDDSEADIEPATHPASRALYVSELVRPLQEPQLRSHLCSLASKSNNPDVMETLYLDQIKTHCFAIFDSVQACARARNGIHNKVWPSEKNRKPLFADFVPEDKVQQWIDIERQERGKKFAVAYRTIREGDEDGERVEAVLEEVLPGGSTRRPYPVSGAAATIPRGRAPSDAPVGPRNPHGSGRLIQPATTTQPGVKVVSLEDLFKCTKTKPKLYYQPVPENVAKERLATKDYHKEALIAAAASRKGSIDEFRGSRKRGRRGGDSWRGGSDRKWDRDWPRDSGRGDKKDRDRDRERERNRDRSRSRNRDSRRDRRR